MSIGILDRPGLQPFHNVGGFDDGDLKIIELFA